MIYIIMLTTTVFLLILDMTIFKKKKLKKKFNKIDYIQKINNKIAFLQYKKGSKEYQKLKYSLLKSGLNITPETFQTINMIVPFIVVFISIVIEFIRYINNLVSLSSMKRAAEILGDESILNIDFSIKPVNLLIVWVITFMLPKIIMKIVIAIRKIFSEKEVLILQTYTIMMLKTKKPVKEILISLLERAKIYKPYIERALKTFSTDQEGALTLLKETSPNSNFKKICISLEQALKNDKELSITYLENHRILSREVNKQLRLRKNKRNEIIGVLLMVFPLFILIAIGAYPWLIYMLKILNNMPM